VALAYVAPRNPHRVFLTLAVLFGLYGFFLPLWFQVARPYARAVASTAQVLGFRAAGLRGGVRLSDGRAVIFQYAFPDARTGKWGTAKQRLLNFPDVPLALALALALPILGWRRRLVVAGLSAGVAFLAHVALVTVSGARAARILADPSLAPAEVDVAIVRALNSANRFGDFSPVGLLVVVLALILALRPRGPAPAEAARPADPPPPASGGAVATS
jgi:hypothetical protein